jgi:hypothetical protein
MSQVDISDPVQRLIGDNEAFYDKTERAFLSLFETARVKNELHFALSLNSEFRGMQDPGWSTADDAQVAFRDYLEFLKEGKLTSLKVRVALAFYCHLAEASGFYEVPKNMMRLVGGELYNMVPFRELVERHQRTGNIIAPNANKILRNLAGHAETIGFHELAEVFRDAFDPDLRNGYAHADYIVWNDGIRLRKRNGGFPKIVSYAEFQARFDRGITFFHILKQIVDEKISSYDPAKVIRGQLADEPEGDWTVHFDPERKSFSISG